MDSKKDAFLGTVSLKASTIKEDHWLPLDPRNIRDVGIRGKIKLSAFFKKENS